MPTGLATARHVVQDTGRWFVRLVGGALLLAVVVAVLGYVVARFWFWPRLDAMATEHVTGIEQRVGARIHWRELVTDWRGLRPSFELKGLVVGEGDRASSVERVAGTLSLRSLLQGRFGLADLRLDRPVITIAREADQWRLAARRLDARAGAGGGGPGDAVEWLALAPDLRVGQGTIRVVTATAGTEELKLDGVDVVLRSRGRLHDLHLDIARPDRLADRLSLQADLLRPRGAGVADWRQWEGTLRFQGRNADPGAMAARALAWLPAITPAAGAWPWPRIAGRVDPDLRIAFRNGVSDDGRLALQSESLQLPATPGGERTADLSQVNVDLRWSRGAAGGNGSARTPAPTADAGSRPWRFELPVLVVRGQPARTPDADTLSIVAGEHGVVVEADATLSRAERVQADLVEATLATPAAWARAWLPGLARLESLGGTARQTTIDWTADGRWRVAGRVDRAAFGLALSAFERSHPLAPRLPRGRDLDLQLQATQAGGKATLTQPKGGGQPLLVFGGVLVEPEVLLNELEARIGWTVLPGTQGLRLDFDDVRFANADAAGRFNGRYVANGRPDGDGQLVIQGSIDRAQARRIQRYLPHGIPLQARDWIRDAFESGQLEGVKFAVNGRLLAFPYRGSDRGEGDFQLAGRFRDVLLRFAHDWPTIQQATGEFAFDRASVRVNGESGAVGAARLEGVTVTIADLGHAEVALAGAARGEAADMVRFVNASPLAKTAVGTVTRPLRAEGPMQLRLSLDLPLYDGRQPKVDGHLDLGGMRVAFDPSQPTFADVRGRVSFTSESLSFKGVGATLHGSRVETDGRTESDGSVLVEARSRISAETLRQLADNSLTRQLDGSADVRVAMRFAGEGRTVRAESDLVGLGSRLPAPLAKAAVDARPLRFEWVPERDAARPGERIEATLDGDLRLLAERTAADRGRPLLITRAAVAQGRAPQLPPRGLALQATLPRIDGDAWLAVFDGPMTPIPPASMSAVPAGTTTPGTAPVAQSAAAGAALAAGGGAGLFADDFSAEPTQISLAADEVRYGNRLYRKVTLEASRAGRMWNSRLQSNEVSGSVQWETGGPAGPDGRLVGRFTRLAIPNSIEGTRPLATDRDARMPALDITADTLTIGDARLGRLELVATNLRSPVVWRLDRLNISSPAATFRAGGTFRETTELDYELRIDNAGRLLEQFGFKGVVRDGAGQMSGKLRWQSVPSNFDIPTLSGEVMIDVRDGQFLRVEPGAAKLIGVLNLQALPKWLKLDFTDLFAKGFAFQELSGRVRIDSGIARTDNLAMRGLEAVVQMQGLADLRRQTQDVRVTILPNLDAGLAALAYAAIINPAVGLGAFLAQSLLGKQLSRAFAHEVDVKGSWVDPQVIPRKRETPPELVPSGG